MSDLKVVPHYPVKTGDMTENDFETVIFDKSHVNYRISDLNNDQWIEGRSKNVRYAIINVEDPGSGTNKGILMPFSPNAVPYQRREGVFGRIWSKNNSSSRLYVKGIESHKKLLRDRQW